MARKNSPRRKGRKMTTMAIPAPSKVSLLPQYAPGGRRRDRKAPPIIPIVIDDPWPENAPAFLKGPPRKAQTVSERDREWVAPDKQPIEVYASRRDVIAGMYARGQIDRAMFLAARDYERIYATAMALPVKTIDPGKPMVSGGAGSADVVDAVKDAADRLRAMERRIARWNGADAVSVIRGVLVHGLTVDRFARRRGHGDQLGVKWWGGTLRRALEELASAAGYAVQDAYRNRAREEERRDRIAKAQERRDREKKKRGKERQRRP